MEDVTQTTDMPRALSQREGVYIYCIVPARTWYEAGGRRVHAAPIGDPSRPIRLVGDADADLAAVVSDAPLVDLAISRDNLLKHEGVIEEAVAFSDVVPLRFGTIAASDDEVRENLLEARRELLHSVFERIRGRAELGLKVFWQRERLFAEITAEDDAIRGLRYAIRAAGAPNFFQQLQLGQLTEKAIMGKREHEANCILDALDPLADETILASPNTDMMILNAAFLVEQARVPEFAAAVGQIAASESGRLITRYTGPLPPYSFADLAADGEE